MGIGVLGVEGDGRTELPDGLCRAGKAQALGHPAADLDQPGGAQVRQVQDQPWPQVEKTNGRLRLLGQARGEPLFLKVSCAFASLCG